MQTIEQEMSFFKTLFKLLKNQFGPESEFILHDWSRGYDHSVAAIENGHITGSKIGGRGSNPGLEVIRGTVTDDMKCNCVTKTRDGKVILSSSMYIRDDDGKALGALCINTDISKKLEIKEYLDNCIPDELNKKEHSKEFSVTNVSDLLLCLLDEGIKKIGKPVSEMTREDKTEVLRFLDDKGALLINKSGTKICQTLEISKYTLYNYLEDIREHKKSVM